MFFQEQQQITIEATRYAQTSFPFPPVIIRFSSGNVKEKEVAQEVTNHWKMSLQVDISITNIRRSSLKCQNSEYDFLIYVKNAESFFSLFFQRNCPKKIGGENFSFPSTPSFLHNSRLLSRMWIFELI